jgi:DNA-binding response OmpR family regulator
MMSIDMLEHLLELTNGTEESLLMAARNFAEMRLALHRELLALRSDAKPAGEISHSFRSGGSLLRPVVDSATKRICWGGRSCAMGHTTLFKLFERLARHPNTHISFEQLLADVWDGNKADETIRSAVRHLKRRLEAAGMAEIAAAIQGQNRHYVLCLDPPQ